jgi:multidrug efflux pump subunit AcrA (membrane-fusion protein)
MSTPLARQKAYSIALHSIEAYYADEELDNDTWQAVELLRKQLERATLELAVNKRVDELAKELPHLSKTQIRTALLKEMK